MYTLYTHKLTYISIYTQAYKHMRAKFITILEFLFYFTALLIDALLLSINSLIIYIYI